jgi:hypothetical protein
LAVRRVITGYATAQIFLTVVPMMVDKCPIRYCKVLGVLKHTLAPVLWYGEIYFRTLILTRDKVLTFDCRYIEDCCDEFGVPGHVMMVGISESER